MNLLNPTMRKFVGLYARSRYMPPIILGVVILLVLATWWAGELAPNIKDQTDRLKAQLQLATIVPLIAGTLVGLSAGSPSGELDDATPGLPRRLQLIFTLGTLLTIGLLCLVFGSRWNMRDAARILVRNLAGWGGLTLLARPFLGSSRAWMPAIAWAGISIFSGQPHLIAYPSWAWSMQPGENRTSALIGVALLIAGIIALVRTPFRVKTE